jgi:hypothetical protein
MAALYKYAWDMARNELLQGTLKDVGHVREYAVSRGFDTKDLPNVELGVYLPKHRKMLERGHMRRGTAEDKRPSFIWNGVKYQIVMPHYNGRVSYGQMPDAGRSRVRVHTAATL